MRACLRKGSLICPASGKGGWVGRRWRGLFEGARSTRTNCFPPTRACCSQERPIRAKHVLFGRSLRTGVLKRQGSCWNKGPDGQCPLICQNSHFAQFCRSIPELKNYPVCVNKSSFLIEIHNYLKLKIVSWVVRCTFAISTGQLTDCRAEVDIVVWVTEWVQRGLAAAHLSFGPPLEKKPFIKCQYHKIVRVPLKYMWGVGV